MLLRLRHSSTAKARLEIPNPMPQTPNPMPQTPRSQSPKPGTSHLRATHMRLTRHSRATPSLSCLTPPFSRKGPTYEPLTSHVRATHEPLPCSSLLPKAPTHEPLTGHGLRRHLSRHSLSVDWTSNGASRMCRNTAAASSRSQVTLVFHQ